MVQTRALVVRARPLASRERRKAEESDHEIGFRARNVSRMLVDCLSAGMDALFTDDNGLPNAQVPAPLLLLICARNGFAAMGHDYI